MKDSDVGILRGDCSSRRIPKTLNENLIKIVCHFRFDLHVPDDVETGPAAKPDKIGSSLPQLKVIDEGADLGVVLSVGDGCKTHASN